MVALALLVAAVAGCASGGSKTPAAPGPPVSPVEGVVIDVDSAGLADVKGFTLRTEGGREFVFVMGDLENAVEFPPAHVGEHLASGEPIRVSFRAAGDDLVAYRIEDTGD